MAFFKRINISPYSVTASCQGTQISSVLLIYHKIKTVLPVMRSSTKRSCTNNTGTLEEVTSEPKITV